MPFYESIFIIRQSLTEEETGGIIDKMKGAIEKQGGTLLKVDNWGKKKLAYEVEHDRRGTFVLFQFEANGQVVGQLERLYRLEDSVLKFLTIRVEEKDLQPVATEETESEGAGVQ